MGNNIDLNYLLERYIEGSISDQEKLQLLQVLDDSENLQKWNELVARLYEETRGDEANFREEDVSKIVQFVLNDTNQESQVAEVHRIRFKKTGWFRYAAAVLIFIGIAGYLYNHNAKQAIVQTIPSVPLQNDVLPGSHKAILTLSDGKKIAVNSNVPESIQDGKLAIDNKNGTLIYRNTEVFAYNTMSTPNAGQYKLSLPDGTKVWLNASSSITFPTAFPGNSRIVKIEGEAYFEVAKNPAKPFMVKTYRDEITVFGTSFNVNCYRDEPDIKTSLLEGSVHINNVVLKPGQAYTHGKITATDMDQDIAWKNDVFNFHHIKLADAMRQIARWYDVDVHYEGKFNDVELGGEIGRNLTLQQVLSGLEDKELHFHLTEKRLTVTQQ